MARRRPQPPHDPARQGLVSVRRGLFRLHKALVQAERRSFERRRGTTSNAQFLQALIHDPALDWLRPFSRLIVEIDEALAAHEGIPPAEARAFVEQVRALVEPEPGEVRYESVRQRDTDVLVAHVELTGSISDALG